MIKSDIKTVMDSAVERINRPEFADSDPIQFPRRFKAIDDIEIVSLLCSHIAWGNRSMICRNCNRLLDQMDNSPADFVRNADIDKIDSSKNIHRTFFGRDLQYFLRGLKRIYTSYATLEDFAASRGIDRNPQPAWGLAEELNREFAEANRNYEKSVRCLPENLDSTPLKRLNMALRWLVRNDGIVDLGVWNVIKPHQLFIPLDVHVANTSRSLGLLTRKSNDRKAVIELTERLRELCPEDPVKYDFALFGLGIESKSR